MFKKGLVTDTGRCEYCGNNTCRVYDILYGYLWIDEKCDKCRQVTSYRPAVRHLEYLSRTDLERLRKNLIDNGSYDKYCLDMINKLL